MRNDRVWVISFAFALGCGTPDEGRQPSGGGTSSGGGSAAAAPTGGGGASTTGGSANSAGQSAGGAAGGVTNGGSGGGGSGGTAGGSGGAAGSGAGGSGPDGGTNAAGGMSGGMSSGGTASGGRSSGGRSSGGLGGTPSTGGRAATAGAGSGGMPANAGAGGCVENLACKLQAPPSTGDLHQDCVDRINQFRTQCACLPPLARRTDGEACADQMAEYDAEKGTAHAGSRDNICTPGGAQNSCPGYSSNNQVISLCLQQMWDEGPPPTDPCEGSCFQKYGHFINMTDTSTKRVACGFFTTSSGKVWAVQNFSR